MMLLISPGTFQEQGTIRLAKFEDIASFQNITSDNELNLKSAQISTMLLEKANFKKTPRLS
jgi:hypothetical protein